MPDFITSRQVLWNRLKELSEIEVMTEGEKYEEQDLSKQFWEWGKLDERIRTGPILFFNPNELTEMQRRVMYLARFQEVPTW